MRRRRVGEESTQWNEQPTCSCAHRALLGRCVGQQPDSMQSATCANSTHIAQIPHNAWKISGKVDPASGDNRSFPFLNKMRRRCIGRVLASMQSATYEDYAHCTNSVHNASKTRNREQAKIPAINIGPKSLKSPLDTMKSNIKLRLSRDLANPTEVFSVQPWPHRHSERILECP
jgi:hypothetical protein